MLDGQPPSIGHARWNKHEDSFQGYFRPNDGVCFDSLAPEASLTIEGTTLQLRALQKCHETNHYHFEV